MGRLSTSKCAVLLLLLGTVALQCLAAAPSLTGTRMDFNGDGRSDLLYRNQSTGQVHRIFMNGLQASGGATVYIEPDLQWTIAGTGDFNGDGVTDLLWRNAATGQVYVSLFTAAGAPGAGAVVHTEPNVLWRIVHTPDLDGDGKADILWWNSHTGQVHAMLMNGTAIAAQGAIYTEPDTAWRIATVGDYLGLGASSQLIWRNDDTGHVYMMSIAHAGGGNFTQTGAMIYREANTAWRIVGSPDLDGDGQSDLLWRNFATGQVYGMLMDGTTIAAQGVVHSEPNLSWRPVAWGDYDGDGRADLLWRNESTGVVWMMRMNGLAIVQQGQAYAEPNTAWQLAGPYPRGLASGAIAQDPHLMFTTSTTYDGSLSGLAGADLKCQSLADTAGIGAGVNFRAWLSATGINAVDRFKSGAQSVASDTRSVASVSRVRIANSIHAMASGLLRAAPAVDQYGNSLFNSAQLQAWTATDSTGSFTGSSCSGSGSDWSSTAGRTTAGNITATNPAWTSSAIQPCTAVLHLYCIGL